MSRRAVGRRWDRAVLLAGLVNPAFPGHAAAAQPVGPVGPPVAPVTLPHSETRMLRSEIVGADYKLFISLPWRYHETDVTYPVLYATDANRNFAIVHGALQALTSPVPETAELVVVGIGYPSEGADDLADWAVGRTRDLTPVRDTATERRMDEVIRRFVDRPDLAVRTGGASAFLRFLREELIPFVESHYRVSTEDRALAGYSYGGLFTLYALFEAPETFSRYFAGSPSLGFGDGFLLEVEQDRAGAHADLPVRLLMTVGELEPATVRGVEDLAGRLRSRNHPSLELDVQIMDGETHRSGMARAWARALRALYPEKVAAGGGSR